MSEKKKQVNTQEQDYLRFHPPLIRLQNTAPHPLRRRVVQGLFALLVFLLIWSVVGRLDIVAVAEGKLIPADYLKIVQPSDAGIVKEILVREGEHVRAGQVLMRMDALITDADLQAISSELNRKKLQLKRIDAELTEDPLSVTGDTAAEQDVLVQLQANLNALHATLDEERARLEKARQELAAVQQHEKRLQAVLPYYREEEQAHKMLQERGFSGKLVASDKRRERIEKEQELATQQYLIASAEASIEQSVTKLKQIEKDYARQLHAERAEVLLQVDRLIQEQEKQQHRQQLLELKAPQEGIVKEVATYTPGTVVQPGTILVTLVPQDERLKVETWVSNADIGFVRVGQPVKLKFTTYSFQKYGMGQGVVEHISADAQSEEEAWDKGLNALEQRTLRYKVLIELDNPYLELGERQYQLSTGMQTTAEILLGNRTVAEYLLSPIQKAWHEFGRER